MSGRSGGFFVNAAAANGQGYGRKAQMFLLSDLRKMTDAELISAAAAIIYSEDLWDTGFSMDFDDKKPNEEFRQLRELVDELHYRHVIKKLSTRRLEPLVSVEPTPAS